MSRWRRGRGGLFVEMWIGGFTFVDDTKSSFKNQSILAGGQNTM